MHEQNIQMMSESQMEAEALEGIGEVTELGDVCETKGGFGTQGDGASGFFNPF